MNDINTAKIQDVSTKTTGSLFRLIKPNTKSGLHVIFNIIQGCTGTDTLVMKIHGECIGGLTYLLFDSIEMNDNTMYVFKHAPFVVQNTHGGKAICQSDHMPDNCILEVIHATSAPIKYSIDVNYV